MPSLASAKMFLTLRGLMSAHPFVGLNELLPVCSGRHFHSNVPSKILMSLLGFLIYTHFHTLEMESCQCPVLRMVR